MGILPAIGALYDPTLGCVQGRGSAFTCTSFSMTILSGMRERWQPKGWTVFLSGSKAENCCQIGSMMYGGSAGTGTLLREA